jgi:hypothetical protein
MLRVVLYVRRIFAENANLTISVFSALTKLSFLVPKEIVVSCARRSSSVYIVIRKTDVKNVLVRENSQIKWVLPVSNVSMTSASTVATRMCVKLVLKLVFSLIRKGMHAISAINSAHDALEI